MQHRNRRAGLSRWLCLLPLLWGAVWAAEITITRVGACDWTCNDDQMAQLSCHTRVDKALQACANRALVDGKTYFVRPAEYRVDADTTPAEPPPDPDPPDPPPGSSSSSITWIPPTENTDGSPLVDLAGYKIYYGPESRVYYQRIDVPDPARDSYELEVAPGAYYIAMTAYNVAGIESPLSNELLHLVE